MSSSLRTVCSQNSKTKWSLLFLLNTSRRLTRFTCFNCCRENQMDRIIMSSGRLWLEKLHSNTVFNTSKVFQLAIGIWKRCRSGINSQLKWILVFSVHLAVIFGQHLFLDILFLRKCHRIVSANSGLSLGLKRKTNNVAKLAVDC